MIILALLHLHCYHPSFDPSFVLVLDDAASEGEPFESVLEGLANFHIASLLSYLKIVALLMYLPHSLPNVDLP